MSMKYIQLEYAGYIVFEKSQQHSHMASKFPHDNVISAGFLDLIIDGEDQVQCHGESQSLHKSSKKRDNGLLFRKLSIY